MPTHVELYDRSGKPFDRDEYRAAMARDKAEAPVKLARARMVPRRFASPDHAIVAMAELMATRSAVDSSCSEHDLECAGFTRADIERYHNDAQAWAAAYMRDQVMEAE